MKRDGLSVIIFLVLGAVCIYALQRAITQPVVPLQETEPVEVYILLSYEDDTAIQEK